MKPKVVWLQGVTCNGNSHSFFNLNELDALLERYEWLYHPILPSSLSLAQLWDAKCDILVIEGGIKKGWQKGEEELEELFLHLAQKTKKIVAVGSCAVYGGVFKQFDDAICGVLFDGHDKSRYYKMFAEKTINIPGCPAHPEWIAYALEADAPILDDFHRPKELYAYTVHSGCVRNEYFEWKIDVERFGTKEGCLYYKQGCQGPFTHGSCNKILWNETASKTRVGTPCFGCTEPDFPKRELFSTKTYMGIPATMPLGVPKRAYLTITGIAKSFHIPRLAKRLFDED